MKDLSVEEGRDINIGGIIELKRAHLAEGEDEKAVGFDAFRVQRRLEGSSQGGVGKAGQFRRHVIHWPFAGKVSGGNSHVMGKRRPAEDGHRLIDRGRVASRFGLRDCVVMERARAFVFQTLQRLW